MDIPCLQVVKQNLEVIKMFAVKPPGFPKPRRFLVSSVGRIFPKLKLWIPKNINYRFNRINKETRFFQKIEFLNGKI